MTLEAVHAAPSGSSKALGMHERWCAAIDTTGARRAGADLRPSGPNAPSLERARAIRALAVAFGLRSLTVHLTIRIHRLANLGCGSFRVRGALACLS